MKILVVDNDPGMRNLLAMAFRHEGLETHLTDDVEEAEGFLRSGSCAALLMDFHLGAGASGAQLLAVWGKEAEMPPFWLVTGTPEEADIAPLQAMQAFQGVIAKPFSILDLVAAVREQAFASEEATAAAPAADAPAAEAAPLEAEGGATESVTPQNP